MRPLRGQVPFGWRNVGGQLKPHREEQKTLDELWRLRQSGKSYGELVEWLTAKGARTKNGGRWDRPTIFYIIKRLQESQEVNRLD
ncbi:MAG: recombinase family protein [Proteobacteria bacterium]|nr:recombinase family protein [Pseudomonadota bacterium]